MWQTIYGVINVKLKEGGNPPASRSNGLELHGSGRKEIKLYAPTQGGKNSKWKYR